MKLIPFAVAGLALSLLLSASILPIDAQASYQDKYRLSSYHDPEGFVVPPPPGPSLWCRRHPKKCYPYTFGEPKVNTRCEACMDRYCNGDGYIAEWEIRRARKLCSVCN